MSEQANSSLYHAVIIGGGVSGALVALNMLRTTREPLRIALVERTPGIGRGVAYSTECPDNLLNVPAGRMSAIPDDPGHFVRWVAERVERTGFPDTVEGSDFLPRQLYGEYVYQTLRATREEVSALVRLDVIAGEAIDLEETAQGGRVRLADGRNVDGRNVVLALGNLPGEYPIRRSLKFYHGPRYVHIPWRTDVLERIRPDDEVLIVGAGLTSIDIILQLHRQGHRGVIHAISRRGLRPQVHRLQPAYPDFLAGESLPKTVTATLHRVRSEIHRAEEAGSDWRAVLDAIRPHSQALWQGWSWEERARFMRHLRPYWEIHRHRLAPDIATRIDALRESGQVKFYAGRLQTLADTPEGAVVEFRIRGKEDIERLTVAKVINCTGPRSDYSKYQHPLLINLLARGLIDHDPLALGLHAHADGSVLRYRNGPVGWLFTIGAPLKGVLWECTAVPEIRTHARALAEKLVSLSRHE